MLSAELPAVVTGPDWSPFVWVWPEFVFVWVLSAFACCFFWSPSNDPSTREEALLPLCPIEFFFFSLVSDFTVNASDFSVDADPFFLLLLTSFISEALLPTDPILLSHTAGLAALLVATLLVPGASYNKMCTGYKTLVQKQIIKSFCKLYMSFCEASYIYKINIYLHALERILQLHYV